MCSCFIVNWPITMFCAVVILVNICPVLNYMEACIYKFRATFFVFFWEITYTIIKLRGSINFTVTFWLPLRVCDYGNDGGPLSVKLSFDIKVIDFLCRNTKRCLSTDDTTLSKILLKSSIQANEWISVHPLLHTSFPVSTPSTICHSRLTVCLPVWLSGSDPLPIDFVLDKHL